MKKYRLIEHNPDEPLKSKEYGVYPTKEEALDNMMSATGICKHFFYRIEEVKESIMDRVKSYEDACKVMGWQPLADKLRLAEGDGGWAYNSKIAHIRALLKLEDITEVLNEGWKPDWENEEQHKWYVAYDAKAKALEAQRCRYTTDISSRLYFKSRELAEYAAKQFAELYKQLLIEKF